MTSIKLTTLDNGLRIISDTVTHTETAAIGIWAGVGTRHEDMRDNGVLHMVEHMLFKGTEKRTPIDIVTEIENTGGHMNAYTSRELTSYHCHVMSEFTAQSLDVLSDMVLNHTLTDSEIERERQVILQEIGMCHDTPDDLIYDNYFETAYPGQSLGAPILGTSEIIGAMSRDTLKRYTSDFYTPQNLVVSVAGNVDHDAVAEQVDQLFSQRKPGTRAAKGRAAYEGGEILHDKTLEQTHIMLGFQGISRLSDDFFAAQALSKILGGNMSSRLFQEIREKRGLVYDIHSFHSAFTDDGQFAIYAGTSPERTGELVPVLCDEILKIRDDVTEEEVARAKTQLKSSLLMARESMMVRADQQAKYLLLNGEILDDASIRDAIEAVTTDQIKRTARTIFASPPTYAALGPLKGLPSYADVKERLNVRAAA